jgi:hypothetical protein
MKNQPPPLKIASPCPKQWEEMTGDDKCRFCGHCQLHVHNLSAMSDRERDEFVERTKQGKACIAYVVRADGTMIADGFWTRLLRPLKSVRVAGLAVLATVLPFWFSSCTTKRSSGMVKGKMQTVTDTSRSGKGKMLLGEAPTVAPPPGTQMTIGKPTLPKSER